MGPVRMSPELACDGDTPAYDGQIVLVLQVLLQQTTTCERTHGVEKRGDEGLKQWRPAHVLANGLVRGTAVIARSVEEHPQQHATAVLRRRCAILCLGQDLEHTLAQADHAAELCQLHPAVTDLAEARPLLANLRQPLGFCRRQAPATAIGGDRYRLVSERSEEASRSHATGPGNRAGHTHVASAVVDPPKALGRPTAGRGDDEAGTVTRNAVQSLPDVGVTG